MRVCLRVSPNSLFQHRSVRLEPYGTSNLLSLFSFIYFFIHIYIYIYKHFIYICVCVCVCLCACVCVYGNLLSFLLRCGTRHMKGVPNETRTHSCRFASPAC